MRVVNVLHQFPEVVSVESCEQSASYYANWHIGHVVCCLAKLPSSDQEWMSSTCSCKTFERMFSCKPGHESVSLLNNIRFKKVRLHPGRYYFY